MSKVNLHGDIAFLAYNYILEEMEKNEIKADLTAYCQIGIDVLFCPVRDKLLEMREADPIKSMEVLQAFEKAVLQNIEKLKEALCSGE